jgi:hypothetical protein
MYIMFFKGSTRRQRGQRQKPMVPPMASARQTAATFSYTRLPSRYEETQHISATTNKVMHKILQRAGGSNRNRKSIFFLLINSFDTL